VADEREGDDLHERFKSIDQSMAIAKGYLDRTDLPLPSHWKLPRAFWRETGAQLEVGPTGQPTCLSEAIVEQRTATLLDPHVHRHRVHCLRRLGHDGLHATQVKQHRLNKSRWKALSWSDQRTAT
jgi:hypothetical protein